MTESKNFDVSDCGSTSIDAKCYPLLSSTLKNVDQNLMDLDLTQMQYELEYLLVSMKNRNGHVKAGVNYSAEKKNGVEISSISQLSEDRSYSKVKWEKNKSGTSRAKSKKIQPAKSQDSHNFAEGPEVPKVTKNDSCDRFWSYLEPYCSEINTHAIKSLKNWIESHNNTEEYQYIPDLGEHYSTRWLMDDILEENRESSKSIDNLKGLDNSDTNCLKENELLKKVQKENLEHSPPLLLRLISNLVEENLMTSPNDVMTEPVKESGEVFMTSSEKSLQSHSCDDLGSRIKKELNNIGVLEGNSNNEQTKDELVLELERLQTLLVPLSNLSLLLKKKLLSLAKEQIYQQETQKKINEVNAKIMESYRELLATKSKNKHLKKKDRHQIRNLLQESDNLIKNLSKSS